MANRHESFVLDKRGVAKRVEFADPAAAAAARKSLTDMGKILTLAQHKQQMGIQTAEMSGAKTIPDRFAGFPECKASFYGGSELARLDESSFAARYYRLGHQTYYLLTAGCKRPPCALMLGLHGQRDRVAGGKIMADSAMHWREYFADQAVLVFPDAPHGLGNDRASWSSGYWLHEDVQPRDGFLWQLVAEIAQHIWIDPEQISIAGYSNGASLALYAATCTGIFTVGRGFCGHLSSVVSVSGGTMLWPRYNVDEQVPACKSKSECLTPLMQRVWTYRTPDVCLKDLELKDTAHNYQRTSVLMFHGLFDRLIDYQDPLDVDEWPYHIRHRLNMTRRRGLKNAVFGKSIRNIWNDGYGGNFVHYAVASRHDWYGVWGDNVDLCVTRILAQFVLSRGRKVDPSRFRRAQEDPISKKVNAQPDWLPRCVKELHMIGHPNAPDVNGTEAIASVGSLAVGAIKIASSWSDQNR